MPDKYKQCKGRNLEKKRDTKAFPWCFSVLPSNSWLVYTWRSVITASSASFPTMLPICFHPPLSRHSDLAGIARHDISSFLMYVVPFRLVHIQSVMTR